MAAPDARHPPGVPPQVVFFRPLLASFLIASLRIWLSVSCTRLRSRRPESLTTVNHTGGGKWCCCKNLRGSSREVFNCFERFIIKGFDYDIAAVIVSVESNHFASCSKESGAFKPAMGHI